MEQQVTDYEGTQTLTVGGKRAPIITNMADVEPKDVHWLWYPYLAYGQLAFMDGDPETGKSFISLKIASCLSQGGIGLPAQDGTFLSGGNPPLTTLLLSAEDALDHTVQPRLVDMGANLSLINVLSGETGFEGEYRPFTLQHIDMLVEAVQATLPALVVIDPIQAYLGRINMNQANQTRPLMEALARVAATYHCAVLCIRHPGKSSDVGSKSIYRGLGSIDMIGAARLGLFVESHPSFEDFGLMSQNKSNIGPHGKTQLFSRVGGKFQWLGPSRIRAEALAGGERGPEPGVLVAAILWLEDYMLASDGEPWDLDALLNAAGEQNITKTMVYKAKKALKIASAVAHDGSHKATWTLPPL